VHHANAISSLSIALGHDASKFDPDGPLPDIPEKQCFQERPAPRDRAAKTESEELNQFSRGV
jgi:alkanesulfonate monooxygenase